ncbi:MAG: hypothetical protein G01um101429_920 [Parcubacteria group bacterium Gr01-1014_29]|nr:MAG: hypothetical protein G01um101429_920 [Parcubacteria group bacterium Gr01-1014_29]
MPKLKKKEESVRVRTGKWPDLEDKEQLALVSLPQKIQQCMNAENPDWDWMELFVAEEEWLVMREYDEGEEMSRIAAVVKARKTFS